MEDILDVYERPYDEKRPVVGVDETSKEIRSDARPAIPATPAQGDCPASPKREDYEYVRNGTSSIFMGYEPLKGRCFTKTSDRRAAVDFADFIKRLCEIEYPKADMITIVLDNLSTHTIGALYEAFPPEEAHRLLSRLEFHYTPTHGSWLNVAEIALNALTRQCINRRFPDRETLRQHVRAWEKANVGKPIKTRWQFTTKHARIKLKRLYPKLETQSVVSTVGTVD